MKVTSILDCVILDDECITLYCGADIIKIYPRDKKIIIKNDIIKNDINKIYEY